MTTIDLTPYTGNGKVRNLSGKDRGLAAREEFGLTDLDQGAETILVKVPDYVYSISTSFFCGLFSESFDTLGGAEGFLEKYEFEMPQELWPQVEQGLERCSYEFQPLMAAG